MDATAEYGGSAGNWTRTGQDWMGTVNLNRTGVFWARTGLYENEWAAVGIVVGGVAVCGGVAWWCYGGRAGRAVEVVVTY